MRKRLLALALVLVMVLSLMEVPVSAETTTGTEGYLIYEIEDGEVTITGFNIDADDTNFNGELVIPDTIEGYPVTTIGSSAFYYCGMTSVTIPDSVTSIDDDAFGYCTSLTSITIPDSVTSIGIYAFENCTSLTSVTIGNGVTSIGYWAFSECTSLTSITISDSVTSIGQCAFIRTGYYNDESNWENGVLYLDCYLLIADADTIPETYEIKDGTTVIADEAIYKCTNLTSITIPDSVTSIGSSAFNGCTSLTSITFEGNAPDISESAFYNVTATAYYPADNDTWTADVMQDYGGTITWVAYGEETELATSGQCGDDAYWSYDATTGTLTIYGSGDMYDYEYGDTPWFSYNDTITSVVIEDGVTSIGDYTFCSCTSLTSVTIPDSMTSIGNYAFYWCTSLTNVTIPDSITSIGDAAFYVCTSLTSVMIPDSVTSIGTYAFGGCTGLTSVTIPNSVTIIDVRTFDGCTGLTSVTIPNSVTSIGTNAFSNCTSLTSVTIPDSVTSIGNYAFYWCTSLTNVTIPDSVTSIGTFAFCECTSLTSITVSDSNENYMSEDGVLFDKEQATLICCPGGKAGNYTIPDGVTSIGGYAFFGCTSLTSVTIPDSVTNIEYYVFYVCTSLTEIIFKGDAPVFGVDVFYDITATAYYPANNSTWTEDVMQDYGGTIAWVAYGCDTGDHIWDDGEITTKAADYESTGIKTYTCTVCGDTKEEEYTFINGTVTSNVRTAILWAAENGISKGYTSGADNGTFGVGRTVTREEMVIFLYRLAKYTGEDVSASAAITFADTDEIKTNTGRIAISWAVAEGITNGYSDGSNTFGPQDECTREQICIFLWRLAGKPSVTNKELAAVSEFSDADEISNNTAKKAIAWAYSKGIIKGYTGSNEFGPTDSCLREQFAIMMYRYAKYVD